MAEGAGLIRLAVFGRPVAQSLSPWIHARFAQQCGLSVDYRAIEARDESFAEQVAKLAAAGGRGCNVTVPFKHAAWRLATRSSERARRAEAANTLVFEADGWFGDNTDGGGLCFALNFCGAPGPEGARIALLGAGGAAAGVVAALLETRPARLLIANRTVSKAAALAARHIDLGPVGGGGFDELDRQGPFDLLVNATSLGHAGQAPALRATWLAPGGLCFDMNYGRAAAPLEAACAAAGWRYANGLAMLVGQAALSFELWTGCRPDPGAVVAELLAAARE